MMKKSTQKLVFILLGILVIAVLAIVTIKYLNSTNPENQFDFDQVPPDGEFLDLETANPESIEE